MNRTRTARVPDRHAGGAAAPALAEHPPAAKATDADQPRIHPTAIIEEGVSVGPRTVIWDHVHARGPAAIGHDCIIGEKTYVAYGVRIGSYVKINARVYICTGITIEDRVLVAAGVIFTNDQHPRAFAAGSPGLAPSGPTSATLQTVVRTGASIGAGTIVGPGLAIGSYAMVGMGSVVTRSVPAHALVYGNPARLHGYVCTCGMPLQGLGGARPRPAGAGATLACDRCGRHVTLPAQPHGVRPLPLAE